ncbi:MAG: hypothetical protein ACF8AM_09605, partial [Rhodopirellula sp. JB055]|uniref:hypothetical protein n=1 Tax=Rhodopirellula sp. JB055 TaxID=3342846 RepID=UPI00370BEE0C
ATCLWIPCPRVLKLGFSQIPKRQLFHNPKRQLFHNPKRQRGKIDVDFASLTRRVMKNQCLTQKRNFKTDASGYEKINASHKSATSKLTRRVMNGGRVL